MCVVLLCCVRCCSLLLIVDVIDWGFVLRALCVLRCCLLCVCVCAVVARVLVCALRLVCCVLCVWCLFVLRLSFIGALVCFVVCEFGVVGVVVCMVFGMCFCVLVVVRVGSLWRFVRLRCFVFGFRCMFFVSVGVKRLCLPVVCGARCGLMRGVALMVASSSCARLLRIVCVFACVLLVVCCACVCCG